MADDKKSVPKIPSRTPDTVQRGSIHENTEKQIRNPEPKPKGK